MILAGDIGGTKTLLALFTNSDNQLIEIKSEKYASNKYESLEIFFSQSSFSVLRKLLFG